MTDPLPPRAAPRVRLRENIAKTTEAIRVVISEAGRRCTRVSQYDILKTLFLADRSHLNKYGRPITYDNYFAMRDGPVASLAYNLLKEDNQTLQSYRIEHLPWVRTGPQTGSGRYYYEVLSQNYGDDVLSPSDVSALSDALTTILSMTYSQIKKLTHDDPAYIEAWRDEGPRSVPMSYGMLFEAPDYEMAERIQALSEMI